MEKFLVFHTVETSQSDSHFEIINLDTIKRVVQTRNLKNDPDYDAVNLIFKDNSELLVYGSIYELSDKLFAKQAED